ncbi:hypothetical protein ABT159_36140 [Streptomyces sp. NPDC001642]
MPGTFTAGIDGAARQRLGWPLRPADPHGTGMGSAEDLDVLAVNNDNTFALRLTVDADTYADAEREARRLADTALREAGLDADDVPLGPAAVTGIDSEIA